MKVLDYFHKQSFRSKLKNAFMAVIVLSVLMTGGLSYSISAAILEKNALKLTQDTVVKSAQIIDEKLNKLMLIMMTFMISQPFHDMMKDVVSGDTGKYYTHLNDLDNVFSQARIAEPLIHSIYVSTPIGEFYPSSMNRNRLTEFKDTFLYQRIDKEKKNLWVEGHEDMLFSGKDRVLSLILEPIFDTPVSGVYIIVNIREDGFRKLVSGDTGGGARSFLLNAAGQPVYSLKDPLVRQAVEGGNLNGMISSSQDRSNTFLLGGESYLLNYAHLGIADWTMTTIQSKAGVLKDMIYVKWMLVAVALAAFTVTMMVSGAFTRYLLRPLQGLMKVMKRVESNDLSARFESSSGDELAQVGMRFNRMLEQIVVLIGEVTEAEANKRAAEIKALSAQMDPHFLYNTLNTIYWKLKLGKVEESQRMVVALSRLFQLGLNKGREITTLSKELEHVRQYLELQSSCYEGLFRYDIYVEDEGLNRLPIPRILLQPLVENSILHGFRDLERGGIIEIEILDEGACWRLIVRDNGTGMGEEQVRTLFRRESENGYAVSNLLRRLQLYYGDSAEFRVDSRPGGGTAVIIALPKREEHQHG
ncbi:sensor histidine kinase [Paenibacillus sp. MMS20-IR301]|uniref:cache domain-containing sensor histidine kinase n=1 Tax=Paenibacillus sp. MMS20-IR301 TaxID=2895946 RepID=UPI0028EB51C0|nr:sensor histidine kinase [Paenibacillus sp. MMS20-IR301]WNS46742.1 sensor histidine kinase [Paenibacillus sp. MMS20-IR301]